MINFFRKGFGKGYSKALLILGLFNLTTIWAVTPVATNPQDDPNGTCYNLMAQADTNPPTASGDSSEISNVETCLADCNQLYQYYADQGQMDTMLQGISYCRNNLTALYYQDLYTQTNTNISASTQSSASSTPAEQPITPPPARATTPKASSGSDEGSTTQEKPKTQPKSINWF